ncbi:MAG: hypothetical protein HC795_01870 [Coleofasciculaceae cyanobacterium RL_1_1]|nr:hypothetical protein [Coleofasciculaceae cyanobacterium RL_1_1]
MSQLMLFFGALIVSWLIFAWLMNVVKTTLSTALMLAALIMLLQVGFGIDIPMLLKAIFALPQILLDLLSQMFSG